MAMMMRIRRYVLLCSLLSVTLASSAGEVVGGKSPGTWTKGNFAQANVACMQAWICRAPDVLHSPDTVVVTTPASSASGICNAAGGPVDSCNVCASNPPSDPCQYWLERK